VGTGHLGGSGRRGPFGVQGGKCKNLTDGPARGGGAVRYGVGPGRRRGAPGELGRWKR